MKIRNGFVSNSSSSSFILTSNRGSYDKAIEELKGYVKTRRRYGSDSYEIHLPIKSGKHCFGREFRTDRRLKDKLNLVTYFLLNEELLRKTDWHALCDMTDSLHGALKKGIKEGTGKEVEYINIVYDYNSMFWDSESKEILEVDHQSDISENRRMFDNEDTMYDFLFNDESAIYVGSDEHYPTFEYEEGANAYREIYGEYPWCADEGEFEFEFKDIRQQHEYETSPEDNLSMMFHVYENRPLEYRFEKREYRKWKRDCKPFLRRLKREGKLEAFEKMCEEEYGNDGRGDD